MPLPTFEWCRSQDAAEKCADFMSRQLDPSYISHSELQGNRTTISGEWVADIRDVLRTEFRELTTLGNSRLALSSTCDAIVAVSVVNLKLHGVPPFAVVEDMIIKDGLRGRGLGTAFLKWIFDELRGLSVRHVYLESGVHNTRAHGFFERNGFERCSIVMRRTL